MTKQKKNANIFVETVASMEEEEEEDKEPYKGKVEELFPNASSVPILPFPKKDKLHKNDETKKNANEQKKTPASIRSFTTYGLLDDDSNVTSFSSLGDDNPSLTKQKQIPAPIRSFTTYGLSDDDPNVASLPFLTDDNLSLWSLEDDNSSLSILPDDDSFVALPDDNTSLPSLADADTSSFLSLKKDVNDKYKRQEREEEDNKINVAEPNRKRIKTKNQDKKV